MKIARFFAVLFGLLGTILLVCSIGLCLTSLDAPVRIQEGTEEAMACAQDMMDALAAGEFGAAAEKMYGQPALGMEGPAEDELGQLVWDAFRKSISYEFTGECYVRERYLCRNAAITMLDIPSVTAQWNAGVHTLLTAEIQAAEERGELMELYDENNDFRPELVERVTREAVEASLKVPSMTTTQITLQMIYRDGQWWVVPDQALLTSLFGGLV